MKVCIPVVENQGLESRVFGHFGSAPWFVVVDLLSSAVSAINNSDQIHQHGACNPVAGLGGFQVDTIVVGGIGGGALHKLNSDGMRVFQAQDGNIGANLELLRANALQEFLQGHTGGGHGNDHGYSH